SVCVGVTNYCANGCSSPCNIQRLCMIIGILKEPDGETRVSLLPDAVQALAVHNRILVERGAGVPAFATDGQYEAAGAGVGSRPEILSAAQCLLSISPLPVSELDTLAPSTILIGLYQPLVQPGYVQELEQRSLTGF